MKNETLGKIKKYDSYLVKKKYGIICRINNTEGTYPLHRHDYIEIEYLSKGKIEHEINGVKQTLKAGDFYGLKQSDRHRFTVLEESEFRNICLYFKEVPQSIQNLIVSQKFPFVGSLDDQSLSLINEWFDKLSNEINFQSVYSKEILTSYLTLIICELFKNSECISNEEQSGSFHYISEAIDYMQEKHTLQITLDEVAKVVHLSPNYFCKLFADVSGSSFSNYLSKIRVEHAEELLLNTNMSITDIAFECGFGSFASFLRTFKKNCGCRPSSFRIKNK